MNPKDWATLIFSTLGLGLGAAGAYYGFVRQSDHLAGVVTSTPVTLAQGGDIIFVDEFPIVLMNLGNRAAAVNEVSVLIDQTVPDRRDSPRCWKGKYLRTDFGPLVIKEKEIVTKRVKMIPPDKAIAHDGKSNANISLPISEENLKKTSFWVETCLTFVVSTPLRRTSHKTISISLIETRNKPDAFSPYPEFGIIPVVGPKPFDILRETTTIFGG